MDSPGQITCCPACDTRFRVTPAQLKVAAGRVRCGSCLHIFAAQDGFELATQTADADAEAGADAAAGVIPDAAATTPTPADLTQGDGADDADRELARAARQLPDLSTGRDPELPPRRAGSRHRSVLEHEADLPVPGAADVAHLEDHIVAPAARRSPLPGVLIGVLLVAALGLQYAWWQRHVLALDPRLRVTYEQVCEVVGCTLPLRVDTSALRSLRLVVRPQEGREDRLLIDALIVNDAPFAQPFPVLELQLTEMNERPLAARRFRPDEYLSGELAGARAMQPRTPVRITLSVVRPGDYGGYQITFL